MDTSNFWHLCYVYLRKSRLISLLLITICFTSTFSFSQTRKQAKFKSAFKTYDQRNIYFGIHVGVNATKLRVTSSEVLPNDSIIGLSSRFSPGFTLGIISNFQIHRHLDIRLVPQLVFADKQLFFTFKEGNVLKHTIPTIGFEFPLYLRYKSKPFKNIRVFVLGGGKYIFDVTAQQKTRRDENRVQARAHDFAVEVGLGLNINLKYFIVSPEFKVSTGVLNSHIPTDLNLSRSIDKFFIQSFSIGLNIEG